MRTALLVATCLMLASSCGGARSRRTGGDESARIGLGPAVTIPGSGVTFEPPPGAALLPLGPGVEVPDLDMTIVVAVADGDEAARRAFREGLFVDGTDARRQEVALPNDLPATLGRDVLPGPAGATARLWLLAERGTRILALLCTYRDGSDERTERLATASLMSVVWDATSPLSPSEAIGLGFGPVQGMAPDRRSLGAVALTEGGVGFPPPAGVPMAFLLPLTEQAPAERSLEACAALIERANVLANASEDLRMLDLGEGWGCERSGEHLTRDGGVLHAHAAVVFLDVGPVLLTALVAPERADEWSERFAALSRTIRQLRRAD